MSSALPTEVRDPRLRCLHEFAVLSTTCAQAAVRSLEAIRDAGYDGVQFD